jgi:hypothetical protein
MKPLLAAQRAVRFSHPSELAFLNLSGTFLQGDRRSHDEYRAEVNEYLTRAAERLPTKVWALAVENLSQPCHLQLSNPTERNFDEVQLDVDFRGDIMGYAERADARVGAIFPPAPCLYDPTPRLASSLQYLPPFLPRVTYAAPVPELWVTNTDDGSRVRFRPVHLRPREKKTLPALYFLAHLESAGTSISGHWSATAKNVDGDVHGTVELRVTSSVTSAALVLSGDGEES